MEQVYKDFLESFGQLFNVQNDPLNGRHVFIGNNTVYFHASSPTTVTFYSELNPQDAFDVDLEKNDTFRAVGIAASKVMTRYMRK